MSNSFHVTVPQMGEGLKYAKVVRILKNVGDQVEEDGDVIEVETAKATLGISSPVAGIVSAISCQPGDMVDVGATLLEISRDGAPASPVFDRTFNQQRKGHAAQPQVGQLAQPQVGQAARVAVSRSVAVSLPEKQIELIHHMRTSQQVVIPASVETRILWDTIDAIKKASRSAEDGADVPSGLEIICWAAAQAMQVFEKFRGRLSPEHALDISAESLIGIAAAGENDTIDTHVASLGPGDGLRNARVKIRASLAGRPGGYHSLSLSDMSAFQLFRAQPVVVYPAAATLFIGAPYWAMTGRSETGRYANLVLAFDHRLANGAYAARFLKEIDANIRRLAKREFGHTGRAAPGRAACDA